MWFVPGSHKTVPLSKRFVRKQADHLRTEFLYLTTSKSESLKADSLNWVCAPTPAGSLVLIDGLVLHKSEANKSESSRWIYTFHMIEGSAYYPENNWLQTPEPFTRL
jgi:phytanoyl-CoA hydroxylase